jgi:MerR family transcriptional regulator/heat shock protein HspR
MYDYDEPVYLISVVAKLMNIHPQTLRQYEREGLLKPSRTEGRMRLYSQRDIDKLKVILTLARDMGVNLAGIDIILQLKNEIEMLQNEIENLKQNQNSIPKNRSVVVKKNNYQIVLIQNED